MKTYEQRQLEVADFLIENSLLIFNKCRNQHPEKFTKVFWNDQKQYVQIGSFSSYPPDNCYNEVKPDGLKAHEIKLIGQKMKVLLEQYNWSEHEHDLLMHQCEEIIYN